MIHIKAEGLLTDWQDAVGLKIEAVESFELFEYDDPITITVIKFDNGVVAIQLDQPSHTTNAGLLDESYVKRHKKDLSISMLLR